MLELHNGEVTMTSVDTGGTDWLWVAMAEHGEDYTDADGKVTVPASWEKMLTMQQGWINDGLAVVSPDGQLDTEGGRQFIMDQKIASFPKALWYMSRFLSYSNGELDTRMHQENGLSPPVRYLKDPVSNVVCGSYRQ